MIIWYIAVIDVDDADAASVGDGYVLLVSCRLFSTMLILK